MLGFFVNFNSILSYYIKYVLSKKRGRANPMM